VPGDIDGSGLVNVTDVQCTIQANLTAIGGYSEPPPVCMAGGYEQADMDCDGSVTVADVALDIAYALGQPLALSIDANGDGCPDVCGAGCGAGEACDDGDLCTHDDECAAGVCAGVPYACFDGEDCTSDLCDGEGTCAFPLKLERLGSSCLIDGKCYTTGELAPDNECAQCRPNTSNETWTPTKPKPCDDGDPCTASDTCSTLVCGGVPIDCDDGLVCTSDACSEGACVHVPYSGLACDDGEVCTKSDQCQLGVCEGTPTSGPACDDGDVCTEGDQCVGGTCAGTPICDDGLPCTADVCFSGSCSAPIAPEFQGIACVIDGACWFVGQSQPGFPCKVCDPSKPIVWSYSLGPDYCFIDGACWESGVHDPEEDCQMCVPGLGPWSWTLRNDWASCTDGDPATSADYCYGGHCAGFDQTLVDSSDLPVQDAYRRASTIADVAYATSFVPSLFGIESESLSHFAGSSLPYSVPGGDLGESLLGPAGVKGNWLVKGGSVAQYKSGGWVYSTALINQMAPSIGDTGSLRLIDGTGSTLHIVGFDLNGLAMGRECIYAVASATWSCANVPPAFEDKQDPVALINTGSAHFLATNLLDNGMVDDIQLLKYTPLIPGISTWLYQIDLAIDAEAPWPLKLEGMIFGGGYLVGIGPGGTLIASDATTDTVLVVPDANAGFGTPDEYDYSAVAYYGGWFLVVGSRAVGTTRFFYLFRAKASSDPMLDSSWSRISLFSALSKACGPSCPQSYDDPQVNAMAVTSDGLFLFGGWYNGATGEQDRASWFRPTP
jgi:hypothetical protein